ncbi:MAG: hypothetical protein NVS4B2_33950 [Chloroflexota bacterium]
MRKAYTATFKANVVRELLKEELTVSQIATRYAVHPTQLHQWKAIAVQGLPNLFVDEKQALDATKAAYEQQLTDLYTEIGKLATQLAWLKKKGFEFDEGRAPGTR